MYLTVNEVCKKLGLERQTVQNMCKKGRFQGAYQTEKGIWLIPEEIFVTTREQDEKAEEILQHIDKKNHEVMKESNVEYIDAKLIGDFYGVTLETVVSWIKQGHLSGKQNGRTGKYILGSYEEFVYLKSKIENDTTEKAIQKLLGFDFFPMIGTWNLTNKVRGIYQKY
ncbi:helix-turn-helix domain-containing protein [Ornithinibacillus bavariensis]|uniref:helix-turn-helix domain-containing protein n=1 Tax=Ornithinibacillus bavariensis TaxID=545502 RepID=UPI000EDCCE8D|nr:hypothetical protein [Ornithinibacillus sp.]